ncbi:hypothetical protein L593_09695 [Salinarchaeum sp. Harcht-Bsk1]|uniref:DUF7269 family protein n=1 Tax=Salinarchaeum sp. Harcht-Bsk1 TaxID=1333523 RepID=UPI0003423AD9|nr:hypothetical protein [Salinarchaeum sp. Harcht-Bsk1]AGN01884.1 hypothetical protein L593_09695 [Salinarchaeum sp. Harcht-Bsk1]
MSAATDRLRRIDVATVGIAIAAVVAVVGIASVFSTVFDFSGLYEDRTRVLLGFAGIAVGAFLAKRWIDTDPGSYRPPERERVLAVDVPGEEFDDLLRFRAIAKSPEAIRYFRSQSREELQQVAIEVLELHQGLDRETARARLRGGSWTADETAAEFFRLGTDGGATEELDNALRRRRGGEHPHTKRARRAVEALARIAGPGTDRSAETDADRTAGTAEPPASETAGTGTTATGTAATERDPTGPAAAEEVER